MGRNIMKTIYVFEEYRYSMGIGSQKIFDNPISAINHLEKEWKNLTKNDQYSYQNDKCGIFDVYKAEVPENVDLSTLNLSEYESITDSRISMIEED